MAASALRDRVAIVTGASSGIGEAIALRFAAEGARVIAVARRADRLRALAERAPQMIHPQPCDMLDHEGLAALVQATIDEHGRTDILVNNAGFSYYERHAESTLEHWRKTQAVNVEAMYVLAKLVAPHMIKAGYGRIVNVSSTQAIAAEKTVGSYAASKGAINAWSRALAVDLAEYGITVNIVAPGAVRTEMATVEGQDYFASDEFQEWYVRRRKIPLGREGRAEEVAAAALFLSSDDASYVTGHTLVVDGGLTITF